MNTRRRRSRARVTRKAFITALKKIYPACKHDESRQHELYEGHKITYGEMDYEGLARLFKHVQKMSPGINTFIDIGSGRGKLCLFMASIAKIKKSIGIELVKARHEDALCLQDKVPGEYANIAKFINANIFDVDLENELPEDPRVFVWFSNLCFDQNTTNDIFEKLAKELPIGSVICCSKIYSPGESTNANALEFIESIPIEMSWSKTSNVHIYKTTH